MNTKHRVGAVTVVACLLAASALACNMPSAVTPTPGITEIFPLPNTAVSTDPGVTVTEPPVAPTATSPASSTDLTIDQLKNLTYEMEIVPDGQATLVNGSFSVYNPEFQANTDVEFRDHTAFGDLNGDGTADALVVLVLHTQSTTGHFYYLIPVLNQGGVPQPLGRVSLGDRIVINSIIIDGGIATVDMIEAGPNDGMCCPNTPAIKKFQLQGTQLVQIN